MGRCIYRGKLGNVAVSSSGDNYIHSLSMTKGLKLGFSVDLEFLDICTSSISDRVTQKWSLDNAAYRQDILPHIKLYVCWFDARIRLILILGSVKL
jgi:hypothetical protein